MIGYISTAVLLSVPSFMEAFLNQLFLDVNKKKDLLVVTNRGKTASDEEKELYFLNSASFTTKVVIGFLSKNINHLLSIQIET